MIQRKAWKRDRSAMLQKVPEDFRGGQGVAELLFLLVGASRLGHVLVGGEAGQPFILEMDLKIAP